MSVHLLCLRLKSRIRETIGLRHLVGGLLRNHGTINLRVCKSTLEHDWLTVGWLSIHMTVHGLARCLGVGGGIDHLVVCLHLELRINCLLVLHLYCAHDISIGLSYHALQLCIQV